MRTFLMALILLILVSFGPMVAAETYIIDAAKNCVHFTQAESIAQKAVKVKLEVNTKYRLQLSGAGYFSQQTGYEEDPMPGVALFYPTNEQDTFAVIYRVMKPGEVIEFTTPPSYPEDLFILAFLMDYWNDEAHRGQYQLTVEKAGSGAGSAGTSFSNPINIDNRFILKDNENINSLAKISGKLQWVDCPYPWVAIEGTGKSKFLYYSFTVKAGAKAVFDVDQGFKGSKPGSADLKVVLWDAEGTPLGGSDHLGAYSWYFGPDPGSKEDTKGVDPYFEWTFNKAGTYIIGVAVTGDVEEKGGWKSTSTGLKPEDTFILNIAVENHEYR